MVIYLFSYAIYFIILGVGLRRKNTRRWLIVALLPMFGLVWLRGDVGVDTPMYVQSIELIQNSDDYLFIFEPGFEFLIRLLGQISTDSLIVVKLIATITTVLLVKSKWQTNIAYQVIGLSIIPYFYFDMTMNGIRYGLAFAIILFSLKNLIALQRARYTVSTFVAASMQVSSLYLGEIIRMLIMPNWKHLLFVLLLLAGVFIFGSEYFLLKASVNSENLKPSISAGAAPLFLSLVVLAGCWKDKIIKKTYMANLVILIALSLITYSVTQTTYAGLRFQQLNYFLILLFIIYASEKVDLRYSKYISLALVFSAIFGVVFRLNNFQSESSVDAAPFVPYKFYWVK